MTICPLKNEHIGIRRVRLALPVLDCQHSPIQKGTGKASGTLFQTSCYRAIAERSAGRMKRSDKSRRSPFRQASTDALDLDITAAGIVKRAATSTQ